MRLGLRRLGLLLLVVHATLLVVATGCGDGARPDECRQCPESCYRWRRCSTCAASEGRCAGACDEEGAPCGEGVCVRREGELICSPYCESDQCSVGEACLGPYSSCTPVMCSERDPCGVPGTFCSRDEFRCATVDGSCTVDRDCPVLHGGLRTAAAIRCIDSTCQIDAVPIRVPTSGPAPVEIALSSPRAGGVLATSAELTFTITASVDAAATFVNVLASLPESVTSSVEDVVWTGTLEPGATSVSFAAGETVVGGLAQGTLMDLPDRRALYAVAYGVREGRVVAVSPLVPFAIGTAPWASIGTTCFDVGALPTADCASPAEPLICTGRGCARICGSDEDCRRVGMTGCDLPTPTVAVRTCF